MYKFIRKQGFCPMIKVQGIGYYLVDEPIGTDCSGNTCYGYKLVSRKLPGPKIILSNHCAVLEAITGKKIIANKLYKIGDKEKTGDEVAEWQLYYQYGCLDSDVYKQLPQGLIEHKMSFIYTLINEQKQRWLWKREMTNEIVYKNGAAKIKSKQKHILQKVYKKKVIYPAKPYQEAEKDAIEYLKNKYGYQEQIDLF